MLTVHLISSGCSREEFISETIDSFIGLLSCTQTLLSGIENRLESVRRRISKLKDQEKSAKQKIESLRVHYGAINLVSTSSFPSVDERAQVINVKRTVPLGEDRLKDSGSRKWAKVLSDESKDPNFMYSHSVLSACRSSSLKNKEVGRPLIVSSSVDLISDIFPMETLSDISWEGTNTDRLLSKYLVESDKRKNYEFIIDVLGPVPRSILENDSDGTLKSLGEKIIINAKSQELPDFDLPSTLPDLSNVVLNPLPRKDNAREDVVTSQSSLLLSNFGGQKDREACSPGPNEDATVSLQTRKFQQPASPSMFFHKLNDTSVPERVAADTSLPEGAESNETEGERRGPMIGNKSSWTPRSDLLEQIRQSGSDTGMFKLKSVATEVIKAVKKNNMERTKQSTLDIFVELHDRLKRRRKGVKGEVIGDISTNTDNPKTDQVMSPIMRLMSRSAPSDDDTAEKDKGCDDWGL